MEFFKAGKDHNERLMLAANRVGKTLAVGGYEMTLHLTGMYPPWWEGRRFNKPIKAWAAGDSNDTVRDIIQDKLLGPVGEYGTGLIPQSKIIRVTPKMGIPDAVKDIYVLHSTGKTSVLTLKSYEQKRISFQGTEQDLIWLDEEPDLGVYIECLMRTMTTKGMIMCTFTPLKGLSDVVTAFLPGGKLYD
jgi:phage terminase large subunit-like protein